MHERWLTLQSIPTNQPTYHYWTATAARRRRSLLDIKDPKETRWPGRGGYLLQRLYHDEKLVKWCFEHTGCTYLHTFASLSTRPIFKLLLSQGAPLEGRILDVGLANMGSRPCTDPDVVHFQHRMESVQYLVEKIGLDYLGCD